MKKIILLLPFLSAFMLAGCGNDSNDSKKPGGDEKDPIPTPEIKDLTYQEYQTSINETVKVIPKTNTAYGLDFENQEQETMRGVEEVDVSDYKLVTNYHATGKIDVGNNMAYYAGDFIYGQLYHRRNPGSEVDLDKTYNKNTYNESLYVKLDTTGYGVYSCKGDEEQGYSDYEDSTNNEKTNTPVEINFKAEGDIEEFTDTASLAANSTKETFTEFILSTILDFKGATNVTYKYSVETLGTSKTYLASYNSSTIPENDVGIKTYDDKFTIKVVLENSILKEYQETEDVNATYEDGTIYHYKLTNDNIVREFKEFTYPSDLSKYEKATTAEDMYIWGGPYLGYSGVEEE